MAILSIIIPVYNAENYLRHSLDSIFCQQEAGDCEVIIVNDGSTDGSLNIIREYESLYKNILVVDKLNTGVSDTRNRGLELASGEYIFFMDADDVLHLNSLAIIIKNLNSTHPDILSWQFDTFYKKAQFKAIDNSQIATRLNMSSRQAFNYLMNLGYAVAIYSKAIRRSVIENEIRFDKSMTYGEDMFFSWKAFLMSKSVEYIPLPLYYYRQTIGSAVSRFHFDLYEKYRYAFEYMRNFAIQNAIYNIEFSRDLDYHFACRLPALAIMECKAPYSKEKQLEHMQIVLNDSHIKRALYADIRLTGNIYNLARAGKVRQILKSTRRAILKDKMLRPIKRLIK